MKTPALLLLATTTLALAADPPEPRFTAVTLDDKIQIGYGLAIADVDGDKAPDVLLADKRQIVWYRNPGPAKAREPGAWTKHLIAENLTEKDNVCLAAQDLDGDGKCELAVGAEWNPGDTEHSGAVFYLLPPADRTQRWEPVKFPSVEPTTHRMRWVRLVEYDEKHEVRGNGSGENWREERLKDAVGSKWALVVVPLHGRGNKNGEGVPVKVLMYRKPSGDPRGEWKTEVVSESMHMTHDIQFWYPYQPVVTDKNACFMIGGREGIGAPTSTAGKWASPMMTGTNDAVLESAGVGQVCMGHFWSSSEPPDLAEFVAAVVPMHGNQLVVNMFLPEKKRVRRVLTDKLIEGHALACGDLLGVKSDQIVVGWRGNPAKPDNTFGIHLWTPLDATGEHWRESAVDDGGMACEDLQLADLDGDGRPDIAASGRATKNVKLYFNDTAGK